MRLAISGHLTVSLGDAVLLDRLHDAVAPRRAVGQARVPLESLDVNEVVNLPGRARRLLTVLLQPGTNARVRRTKVLPALLGHSPSIIKLCPRAATRWP